MAYYTGSISSFTDLKNAIETACVTEGWTLLDGILSKDGCYVQLTASTTSWLNVLAGNGQSGTTLVDPSPIGGRIISYNNAPFDWPVEYDIHIFNAPEIEVYVVVKYNTDFYQQLSFGQSRIPGIGGTGNWMTAGRGSGADSSDTDAFALSIQKTYIHQYSYDGQQLGFFIPQTSLSSLRGASTVHLGLDAVGWYRAYGTSWPSSDYVLGLAMHAGLMATLPNLQNQATVLLPAKAIKGRDSGGGTIVWNPPSLRITRNDNLAPGAIVQYGTDQWKVYPAYRKNANQRDGEASGSPLHSGTLAYAIRYTGS